MGAHTRQQLCKHAFVRVSCAIPNTDIPLSVARISRTPNAGGAADIMLYGLRVYVRTMNAYVAFVMLSLALPV